jgi:NRPS condensation-like uncharacterized protein
MKTHAQREINMNYFNRKLGLLENLFEILHDLGAIIDVNVARIEGTITPDIVQQALYFVQKRHPMLQVHIVESADGFYFQSEGTPEIPLRVIDKQYEEQWIEIAQNELHQKFPDDTSPLCRITLLRSSTSNGINEIIATFHHAITDGISCMRFFDDLLTFSQKIAAGEEISEVVTMQLLPPLEDLLGSNIIDQNNFEQSQEKPPQEIQPQLLIEEEAPASNRHTHLVPRILSKEMTLLLRNCCKQEQTTVHGALCAAMLFAAAKIVGTDTPIYLSCGSSVNLRKYCEPEINNEYMACLVSNIKEIHSFERTTLFWDLARECKSKISQSISRRVPHQEVSNRDVLTTINKALFTQMSEHNMGRSNMTYISNLGQFHFAEEYGRFKLKELYFATGLHIIGDCFWLGVVTFHEQIFCTFTHVVPLVSVKTAELFVDSVLETLEKACTSLPEET